jgi:hypothetical protein
VLVVRGTKKLLDRVGGVTSVEGDASTTGVGDWYAALWGTDDVVEQRTDPGS